MLVFVSMALCFQVEAQRRARTDVERPRNMVLIVRDTLGNSLDHLPVMALFKDKENMTLPLRDGSGNRYFRVRERDTIEVLVNARFFRVPVAGIDSLVITLRKFNFEMDSLNHIDPVTVRADAVKRVNNGYWDIPLENAFGIMVNMRAAELGSAQTVSSYLHGRVAGLYINYDPLKGEPSLSIRGSNRPPLLVVDGVRMNNSIQMIDLIPLIEVASIYVIKGAGTAIYGTEGSGGVIVITTKRGRS